MKNLENLFKKPASYKKSSLRSSKGFTIIELLIVITIMVIVVSSVLPMHSAFLNHNQEKTASWEIVDTLTRARMKAMTGHHDQHWGVHFNTNQFVLFQGNTFNPNNSNNEIHNLLGNLDLDSINLNGRGNEIIFEKITGYTNQYGSITLKNTNSGEAVKITVNETGRINNND